VPEPLPLPLLSIFLNEKLAIPLERTHKEKLRQFEIMVDSPSLQAVQAGVGNEHNLRSFASLTPLAKAEEEFEEGLDSQLFCFGRQCAEVVVEVEDVDRVCSWSWAARRGSKYVQG
jgi:hypothetical protein